MDIYSMTPRQLVAGLMRGNAADFQQGYNPMAATMSAARIKDIEEGTPEFDRLLAYAEGFVDGLVEDGLRANPAARVSEAA